MIHLYFKIIRESWLQALGQLLSSRLRSFLSLLGIAIGIFCIIAVKSAVDSLEVDIRNSFNRIGDDIIYIAKMPWNENPTENFWKYMRRPSPSFQDYTAIRERSQTAGLTAFYFILGGKTVKFANNYVENVFSIAHTYEFGQMHDMQLERGRYFSDLEYRKGSNKVILGFVVAEQLFGQLDPIGKEIKIMGQKMEVVGVVKKAGKSLITPFNFDECALLSYEWARSVANVTARGGWSTSLEIKAKKGISVAQLKDEITPLLRAEHRLLPIEKDNFSINEITMFASALSAFFSTLNGVGLVIGGFALLVGMFSVANIMFVSVKERTNIIGIKKALGATQNVILIEFLIESIILCLLGGFLGLFFVWLTLKGISQISDFNIYVSFNNVLTTLFISIAIGVIAGMIPALQAARLDPVEAIRQ